MTQNVAELLNKALTLPVAERAELAGSLIESLDRTEDESVERPGTKRSVAGWQILTQAGFNRPPRKGLAEDCSPRSNDC